MNCIGLNPDSKKRGNLKCSLTIHVKTKHNSYFNNMRDFTPNEIEEIKKRLKFESLFEILFSEEFSDCNIYTISSKPPMDEWEFEGAFLYEKDAMLKYDAVVKSWGYDGMGISVDVSPISMKELKLQNNSWQMDVISSLKMNAF